MSCQCIASGENFIRKTGTAGKRFPAVLSSYRKLRFHTIKMLREDAHSAQGEMVAEATAPRRENVLRHILFYIGDSCEVRSFFRLSSKTPLTLLEKEV